MSKMCYEWVHFHGCRFGLKSIARGTKGRPIKKPWTVATDCEELRTSLDRKCPGGKWHVDSETGNVVEHAPCSGVNTKITEGYTDEMAKAIHRGHCNHMANAIKCQPCLTDSQTLGTTYDVIRQHVPFSRRGTTVMTNGRNDVDATHPFQSYARSQHRGGRRRAEDL